MAVTKTVENLAQNPRAAFIAGDSSIPNWYVFAGSEQAGGGGVPSSVDRIATGGPVFAPSYIRWTGGGGNTLVQGVGVTLPLENIDLTGSYTFSMYNRVTTTGTNLGIEVSYEYYFDSNGSYTSNAVRFPLLTNVTANVWRQIISTVDLSQLPPYPDYPVNLGYRRVTISVYQYRDNGGFVGGYIHGTGAVVAQNVTPENSVYDGHYFDGSFTSTAGTTYSWQDTPHNSISVERTVFAETDVPNIVAELRILEDVD